MSSLNFAKSASFQLDWNHLQFLLSILYSYLPFGHFYFCWWISSLYLCFMLFLMFSLADVLLFYFLKRFSAYCFLYHPSRSWIYWSHFVRVAERGYKWLAISSFNFDLSFSLIISPLSYENLFLEFAFAIKFKVDLVLVMFLLNVKCFRFKEVTLLSKNRMVDGFLIYIVEYEMKKLCSLVSLTCYTQRWIW